MRLAYPIIGGIAACCLLVIVGCGSDDGPERHSLTGTVTFDGKPVPKGSIEFVPNADAGTTGPASYADIEAGKFETPEEKGIVGGDYIVTIMGYDGVATVDEAEGENPRGAPLFSPYKTEVKLPEKGGEFNFEVPGK